MCVPACRRRHLLTGLCLVLLAASPAGAQSVDYGAMEQIFGEPITTSATGSPQRAPEAPADMTIVTQDDIRRSGADNIPDSLASVPGIEISRNSFGDAEISIRGYNTVFAPRLLVLLNGRPVFDDFFAYVAWGAIPVELADIRQIEVVRGPNSALFGFNAAAGVINIVTFDPLHDKLNTASVRTGTQGLAEGSATATVQHQGRWGVRLSVGGTRANEFSAQSGQAASPEHPLAAELSAEARYLVRPGVELSLEAGTSDNRYIVETGPPYDQQLRIDYQRAALTADTGAGLVDISGYRTATREVQEIFANPQFQNGRVDDVQASDTVKLGAANILRANLEYRDNTSGSPSFFHGTFGFRDVAASLTWNRQLAPGLSLANTLRYDRLGFDYSGAGTPAIGFTQASLNASRVNGLSFNTGLVWAVTPADTLRLLLARGLELPSLVNAGFQQQIAPATYLAGKQGLAPTAVTSAELSYDRTITAIASTVHGGLFAERNDDLAAGPGQLGPVLANGAVLIAADNVGHSDAAGMELWAKGSLPSGLRWNASYALAAITDHLHPGLPHVVLTSYARSTPRNILAAGLGYTVGAWELDTSARWQSHYAEAPDFNSIITPLAPYLINGFLTLDARAAYTISDHLTLAVSGNQALRSRIVETPGFAVERRVIVSLTAHL